MTQRPSPLPGMDSISKPQRSGALFAVLLFGCGRDAKVYAIPQPPHPCVACNGIAIDVPRVSFGFFVAVKRRFASQTGFFKDRRHPARKTRAEKAKTAWMSSRVRR